jgi:hypothetical protein
VPGGRPPRPRGRGQQLAGQALGRPQPGQGQGGGHRRPGQQGDPLLGPEPVGERPALGQGGPGVPDRPVRRQDQPGPDQGLEGVGQGDHLAGAADPGPRHRRDEAVVDPVDQEPAQLRPDPGVAADQVPEPGHEQGPHLGRLQPRWPPDGPAQEEISLMVGLGRRGQVDRGQPARARADPVDAGPGVEQRRQLGLAGRDPLQQRRGQGQPPAAPGHRLDRLPGQVLVAGQGDHWPTVVRPVWLGGEVDMVAPAGVCLDR